MLLVSCRGPSAPNYDLVCDSADTKEKSTLFCMRLDTRNGEVLRVDLSRLSKSEASSRAADEVPGSYQLVCDSTDTEASSEFRCVRLHRRTGDLLLVTLPQVGVLPPAPAN